MNIVERLRIYSLITLVIFSGGCAQKGAELNFNQSSTASGVVIHYLSIENNSEGQGSKVSLSGLNTGDQVGLYGVVRELNSEKYVQNIEVNWAPLAVAGSLSQNSATNTLFTARTAMTSTLALSAVGYAASADMNVGVTVKATNFDIVLDNNSAAIGSNITGIVKAVDAFGNLDTSYNSDVSINAGGSAAGGGVVNIENGIGSFSFTDATPETLSLTLSSSTGTISQLTESESIEFTNQATQFVILSIADTASGANATVTIEARDHNGNKVGSYNDDVNLVWSGLLSGTSSIDIVNGAGNYTLTSNGLGSVSLSLTSPQGSISDATSTQSFSFVPGAPTQFVINTPSNVTAGTNASVVVEAQDALGHRVTTYTSDVDLNWSGVISGTATIDIVSGSAAHTLSSTTAGSVALSLSNPQGSISTASSTGSFDFLVGAPSQFVITSPSDTLVGANAIVTIEARDSNSNRVTTYNDDVDLNWSGPISGTTTVNMTSGLGTHSLTHSSTGSISLSLSNPQGSISNISSTGSFNFIVGPPTQFVISATSDTVVGNNATITVQAQDAGGNTVTTYSDDVDLVWSGLISGSSTINISSGTGSHVLTSTASGSVGLSLANPQGSISTITSTDDFDFLPGSAVKFVIIAPSNTVAGTNASVVVQAQDTYGNKVTSYNDDVNINWSGVISGSSLVNISSGQGSNTITHSTPGTVNLSLTSPQGTISDVTSTGSFDFIVGPPTQFVIAATSDTTAGNNATVTVQAQDAGGNKVSSYNDDVDLVWSGLIAGTTTIDISSGEGTHTLSSSSTGTVSLSLANPLGVISTVTSTDSFDFVAGAATKFIIIPNIDLTVGGTASVTVQAQDTNSNKVTTYNDDVDLVWAGLLSGSTTIDIVNGQGTHDLTSATAGTVNLSLANPQGVASSATSTDSFDFLAGSATQFVLIATSDLTAGSSATITIQAQDASGNRVNTYHDDVDLVWSGVISGTTTINISSGQGTSSLSSSTAGTVNLSLINPQGSISTVSSTDNFDFTVGSPSQFVIIATSDTTAGNNATVTVQAQDSNGNKVTSYNDDVDLVWSGLITGSTTIDITSGEGTHTLTSTSTGSVGLSLSNPLGSINTASSTDSFDFTAGASTQFAILAVSDTDVAGSANVTVQAQDSNGNRVTTYHDDVTLVWSGIISGSATLDIVSGQAIQSLSSGNTGTVNLSLASPQGSISTATSTDSFDFTTSGPSSSVKFALLDVADTAVGTNVTVTIQAQEVDGSVDTSYQSDVDLVISGAGINQTQTIDITSGVGSYTFTSTQNGLVNLSLTNSVGSITNLSSTKNFNFLVGAQSKFIVASVSKGYRGYGAQIVIWATDAYGNLVTSYPTTLLNTALGTVGISGGASISVSAINFVAGVGTFYASSNSAGTSTVLFNQSADPSIDIVSSIPVNFGGNLTTTFASVPSTFYVGATSNVIAHVKDENGDFFSPYASAAVPSFGLVSGNTTYLQSCTSGCSSTSYAVPVDGIITFITMKGMAVGTGVGLSFTAPSGVTATDTATADVAFSSASQIQLSSYSTSAYMNEAFTVYVKATNATGVVDTTINGTVQLAVSGSVSGSYASPSAVTLTNGSGSLSYSAPNKETLTISIASDSMGNTLDHSSTLNMPINGPTRLTLDFAENLAMASGYSFLYLKALDANGNIDYAFNESIPIALDNPDATHYQGDCGAKSGAPDECTRTLNSTIFNKGVAIFPIRMADVGSVTASFNSASFIGVDLTDTATINAVQNTTATHFHIVQPQEANVGESVTVTVQARKTDQTVDTSYQDDVDLDTTGSASGGGTVTITNGTGTINISNSVSEIVTLSLSNPAGGSPADSSYTTVLPFVKKANKVCFYPPCPVRAFGGTIPTPFSNPFTDGTTTPFGHSGLSMDIEFGDFNDDGNIDTLEAARSTDGGVYLVLGDGTRGDPGEGVKVATFPSTPAETAPKLIVADFDSDNDLDFLVYGKFAPRVYFNSGDGTFPYYTILTPPIDGHNFGDNPSNDYTVIANATDFNMDGYLDVSVSFNYKITTPYNLFSTDYIFHNNRNQSFASAFKMTTAIPSIKPRSYPGRFNADARPDIHLVSKMIYNFPTGYFPVDFGGYDYPGPIMDLNLDGIPDVIGTPDYVTNLNGLVPQLSSVQNSTRHILFGKVQKSLASATKATDVEYGFDLNGDNMRDFILCYYQSGNHIEMRLSNGQTSTTNYSVAAPVVLTNSTGILCNDAEVIDLDGDGALDLVELNASTNATLSIKTIYWGAP